MSRKTLARPWYRLHMLSQLAMLPAGVPLAWLNARPREAMTLVWREYGYIDVWSACHGWPFVCSENFWETLVTEIHYGYALLDGLTVVAAFRQSAIIGRSS